MIVNGSFSPADYRSVKYDLASAQGSFDYYYTFSNAYFDGFMRELLDEALVSLAPELATDQAKQASFRSFYYSGNDAKNTITDLSWPVYWCSIWQMDEQGLIDCVNSY